MRRRLQDVAASAAGEGAAAVAAPRPRRSSSGPLSFSRYFAERALATDVAMLALELLIMLTPYAREVL